MPGPSAGDTSKTPVVKQKQGMMVTPAPTQRTTDQLVADEKKGATDKEIQVYPTDADKKLRIIAELEAK
jgi:ribosomal protein L15E